jgi:hypothetical protein
MTSEEEEKVCMFCLELKKGRRQHKPIEFKKLFACDCIFQSHAECIIKWQISCGEDDLQCPICRVKLIVPEDYYDDRALVVYHAPQQLESIKKILVYFLLYSVFVYSLFFLMSFHI